MNTTGEIVTMELNSQPESLSAVEKIVEDVKNKFNVNEDAYGNMLVALTEAVSNAIYHGNQLNPKKKINLSYQLTDGSLSFTISDQGTGFDFYNLPDPTAPENLEKECGRGIFLMKHLSDQVIFSENGRVVELYFKIPMN
ncbi:MAG TPA: ATP-binding protein [Bacteroidia bacterium]|nr:ATP-binding protein [Bacteroidia bacterium]